MHYDVYSGAHACPYLVLREAAREGLGAPQSRSAPASMGGFEGRVAAAKEDRSTGRLSSWACTKVSCGQKEAARCLDDCWWTQVLPIIVWKCLTPWPCTSLDAQLRLGTLLLHPNCTLGPALRLGSNQTSHKTHCSAYLDSSLCDCCPERMQCLVPPKERLLTRLATP